MIGSSWVSGSWADIAWLDGSWADVASAPVVTGGGAGRPRTRRAGGAAFPMYAPRPAIAIEPVAIPPTEIVVITSQSGHHCSAVVDQSHHVTALAVQRPHTSEAAMDAAPFAEDEELALLFLSAA